jgi:hypothetical protein
VSPPGCEPGAVLFATLAGDTGLKSLSTDLYAGGRQRMRE